MNVKESPDYYIKNEAHFNALIILEYLDNMMIYPDEFKIDRDDLDIISNDLVHSVTILERYFDF